MILRLNNESEICSFTHVETEDGSFIVRDRINDKFYMVLDPVETDGVTSGTVITLYGEEKERYSKLLRMAILESMSHEDVMSMHSLALLFHLQSDRDLSMMSKEAYDELRNSVIYDLFGYFDMYPNNITSNWYNIEGTKIGLNINYSYGDTTYKLEYGYATLDPSAPLIFNKDISVSQYPKESHCAEKQIDFLVQYQMVNKPKEISISFAIVDDES